MKCSGGESTNAVTHLLSGHICDAPAQIVVWSNLYPKHIRIGRIMLPFFTGKVSTKLNIGVNRGFYSHV